MIKLSLIIPAYNADAYLPDLMGCLKGQLTDEVEVIVVDDGSNIPVTVPEPIRLIRRENSGVSAARNRGLEEAQGEYIAFIDADDLVSDRYVPVILSKIESEHPDYIYLSWRTIGQGWKMNVKLNTVHDSFPSYNQCVWNRVYKRSMIGNVRFNEAKKIAEDAEFIRSLHEPGHKKSFIADYMYYYRSDSADSLTKRFSRGEVEFSRIVYNIPVVTEGMRYLVDEFREADKDSEVILMTHENKIPELARYAMVMLPAPIKGTELRGTPTNLFTKIEPPIKTQVVIYTAVTFAIGGIETFIYNFCSRMREFYDILVLYDTIDSVQRKRLQKIVDCRKRGSQTIVCDTVIVNRITDKIPSNIKYKKAVQMVHACKMVDSWTVPTERDEIVCVSEVVKNSFDLPAAKVINNLTVPHDAKKPLILVTASRLSTFEKGSDRMIQFAKALKNNGIEFIWFVFSDQPLKQAIPEVIYMPARLDVSGFMALADYVVQLSDAEGFCYTIVEALELGTPVVTTPLPVLSELGFKNNKHGYTVPFDLSSSIDLTFLLNKPKFKYCYDNDSRVAVWRRVLGDIKPTGTYRCPESVTVEVIQEYYDTEVGQKLNPGEFFIMSYEHATDVVERGFGRMK